MDDFFFLFLFHVLTFLTSGFYLFSVHLEVSLFSYFVLFSFVHKSRIEYTAPFPFFFFFLLFLASMTLFFITVGACTAVPCEGKEDLRES